MSTLPEHDHLNSLLDDALAGTFPASDPTSSFVCEGERPKRPQSASAVTRGDRTVPHVNAALLAERSEVTQVKKFSATLPTDWRGVIEQWVAGSSHFLVLIDLPNRMLVGTPDAIADVRAVMDVARAEDRRAILHLKFMCTDITVSAFIDDPVIAAVDWSTPPARR